jgi:hypothetical protein
MPAAIPHAGRTELEGDVRRAGASLGSSDRSQDVTGERLEARRTSVPRPVHTACVRPDRRRRVSRVYTLPYVSWSVKPYAVKPYGAFNFFAYSTPVPYDTPVASGIMLYQSHPTVKRTIFTACYEYVAISSMLRPEASRSATKSGSRPDGDSGTTLGLGAAAAVPLAPPPRPFWAAAAVSVSP